MEPQAQNYDYDFLNQDQGKKKLGLPSFSLKGKGRGGLFIIGSVVVMIVLLLVAVLAGGSKTPTTSAVASLAKSADAMLQVSDYIATSSAVSEDIKAEAITIRAVALYQKTALSGYMKKNGTPTKGLEAKITSTTAAATVVTLTNKKGLDDESSTAQSTLQQQLTDHYAKIQTVRAASVSQAKLVTPFLSSIEILARD
jgi:hypothetical protein